MNATPDSNREFAAEIVRRLREAGYTALWAGGCVRDLLLGRAPKDYDVATNALPDEVHKLFGHRRTLAVGASFGVIIVLGPDGVQVEVATFRSEGPYLDGRRPGHVVFTTPEEDAKRRDFTINGMFYDPIESRVHDYVGGEHDLGQGIVRAIGDPHERMREDKLRMLRAVRFTATLEFELDAMTAAAVREMAGEITVVSAERIAQELKRMLVDPHRRRAMELADELGLLRVILPDLRPLLDEPQRSEWNRTQHMLQLLREPSFGLAMATLLHALEQKTTVEAIGRQLRLSNGEIDHSSWLVAHQHDLDDAPRLPLSKLKRTLAHPLRQDLLTLLHVRLLASDAELHPVLFCEEYLRTTPADEINPPPLITGDVLIQYGLRPGPQFKIILEAVRDAQLEGRIHTTVEALDLARQLQE